MRLALAQDIDKDALHALLMEFIVFAETNQVAQQAFLIDLWSCIRDLHAAPVRLARYQAIRFEQVRDEFFFHRSFIQRCLQELRRRRVLGDFQVQAVEQYAIEFAHFELAKIFLQGQFHLHGRAKSRRQILLEQGQQRIRAVQFGLVERVQV